MFSSPTCSHSDWLVVAAVQALVLPCLSRRAKCGCQVKASMPQVRKVLEDVIWRSDTNRDFMPIGSEQPEVFEYTVEVRPGEEEPENKRNGKKEKESMIDRRWTGQPVM